MILDALRTLAAGVGKAPELQAQLIKVQQDAMEMLEAVRRLEGENRDLRGRLALREQLRFVTDRYWREKPDGTREGPFCSRCMDKGGDLVHLHPHEDSGGTGFICPVCQVCVYDTRADPGGGFVLTSA